MKNLDRRMQEFLRKYSLRRGSELGTEGLKVQAYFKGKKCLDVAFGQTYEIYDLASLTKPLITVPLIMECLEKGYFSLETSVSHWYKKRDLDFNVLQLLNHSSGVPWWHPFYLRLSKVQARFPKKWQALEKILIRKISKDQRGPIGSSVYSDLGFLLLGGIILREMSFDFHQLWEQRKSDYGVKSMCYQPGNKRFWLKQAYAPSEICPWRKRIIQGEVHDENAWSLGGQAPHAGLFGPIDDVSRFMMAWRSAWLKGKRFGRIPPETIALFSRRSLSRKQGQWALGWMMPDLKGSSSGRYFSLSSIGHLGFTGNSVWLDPKKDLLVVILSNRTYPSRENRRFVRLRSQIHNAIARML